MSERINYVEFFGRATGFEPHGYQRRVAEANDLPELIDVPPGYGKTAAIVLGWLWRRRFHPNLQVRASTSRRLVYALPQRALTDQIAREVGRWLEKLSIDESELGLHVIMGGRRRAAKAWRAAPENDSILVGTVDMITSKALVRAYGTPRHAFPMDAALVWNDAHLVIDEVQGAAATTVTLRQVDAFRVGKAVGPSGLTCMSATVPREIIDTVDNPFPDESRIVRLGQDDNTEDLIRRRAATRMIHRLADSDPQAVSAHAIEHHRPATLTLVIVNTVKSARAIHAAIQRQKSVAEVMLLHSQFRPVDRAPKLEALASSNPPQGRIVVATQVVEAGIDVDADVVVTEITPWTSLIQRSGRCNRCGHTDDAEFWWFSAARPAPYAQDDLDVSEVAIATFEGRRVSNEELLRVPIQAKPLTPLTLRRSDFASLFDTSPDLSGHDLDIAPYVRDTEELSVQICWMEWDGSRPPDKLRPLDANYRCRVHIGGVADLIKAGKQVWRFDPVDGAWRTVDHRSPARPGDVLLVRASTGGYRREVGFEPSATLAVPIPDEITDDLTGEILIEDSADADPRAFGPAWISLDQHLNEAATEARNLVAQLDLSEREAADVVLAARVHDIGKAHPTWQDALCATATEVERDDVLRDRPWAKSADTRGRLKYAGGITRFRHELASLLLLDGPFSDLLHDAHDPGLVRYLVLAHHGTLRVQVRDPKPDRPGRLLGLQAEHAVDVPGVLDQQGGTLRTSLVRFDLAGDPGGGADAWPDVVSDLIQRYGVFRLSYLETLVRIADWRASALHEPARGSR